MKDSLARLHLSPKNDKKFTNESIRQSPLKATGQRSWRSHQAGTICRINSVSTQRPWVRTENEAWVTTLFSESKKIDCWKFYEMVQLTCKNEQGLIRRFWCDTVKNVTLIRYQLIKGMKYKLAVSLICMKLTLCVCNSNLITIRLLIGISFMILSPFIFHSFEIIMVPIS